MKGFIKNNSLIIITVIASIGTLAGLFLPWQDHILVQTLRISMGSLFILFLPGYFLTKVFFQENEIDLLERFALSFALSISVIPLLTFYANLAGVPISGLSIFSITLVLIASSSIYSTFFQNTPNLGISTKKIEE